MRGRARGTGKLITMSAMFALLSSLLQLVGQDDRMDVPQVLKQVLRNDVRQLEVWRMYP